MSDIFQEVQEEYRREQMAQLWSKYRIPTIAAAGGLILAVAVYQGWMFWKAKALDASSRQFEAASALTEKDHAQGKAAATAFGKLAQDGAGGYGFAAKFQEAAVLVAAGDLKGAVAIYDRLANDGSGGALFADYAQVRSAVLLVDTVPVAEIKRRLDAVAGSDSPWRIQAEELLGYANWRAGNKAEALRLLNLVKNNVEAPDAIKRRATELSALIAGGMTLADLKSAPTVTLTAPSEQPLVQPGAGPIVPELPTFDAPQPPAAPTNPSSPTPTP